MAAVSCEWYVYGRIQRERDEQDLACPVESFPNCFEFYKPDSVEDRMILHKITLL